MFRKKINNAYITILRKRVIMSKNAWKINRYPIHSTAKMKILIKVYCRSWVKLKLIIIAVVA